jgi:hypothetical protein
MKGERVIENALEPKDVPEIRAVATIVHDDADRLSLLHAVQHSCDATR